MAQRRPDKTLRIVMNAATNRHDYTKRVWRDSILGEYEHRWQAREAIADLQARQRSNGWALDTGLVHQDGFTVSRRDSRDEWPRRWISQVNIRIEQWTSRDGWL